MYRLLGVAYSIVGVVGVCEVGIMIELLIGGCG